MTLTTQEKELLREVICLAPRVTPQILKDYLAKNDEEVRAIIADFKAKRTEFLNVQKARIEAELATLQ